MLYVTKITQASSSVSFVYLNSEHVWGKKISSNYTFSILDTRYEEDSDTLLTGIDALQKAYANRNISAKIGFDFFRNGRVTSLSFPESDRARSTTASISIEETVKVEDDDVLSDLFHNIPSPQDVENFSESLSFDRGEGSYGYNRSLSFKYAQDTSSTFLEKSKLFIKNIFLGNRPSLGYLVDGISENGKLNDGLRPLVSEEYDEINKQMSFTETLSTANIIDSNGYKFSRSETLNKAVTQEGYTERRYQVDISALEDPLETTLNSGIAISLDEIISANIGEFGYPTMIERSVNSDGGLGNFSVSFSSDPRKNQLTTISYNVNRSRGSNSFSNYSFSLDVSSKGPNRISSFNSSKDFLINNPNIGVDKVSSLFPEVSTSDLNEISRTNSFDPFNRSASVGIEYTTDPEYKDNSDGILKRSVRVSEKKQVNRQTILPIYGFRELAIENAEAQQIGSKSVSVDLVYSDSGIQNPENEALLIASGELPEYNYYYMSQKDSSLNPIDRRASANLTFIFFD